MGRVLMDLHPCFNGYSGIPQDTRLTLGLLSKSEKFEVGGHLLGLKEGTNGFPWKHHQSRRDSIQLMSQHLVALNDEIRRYEWAIAKNGLLRSILRPRNQDHLFRRNWRRMLYKGRVSPKGDLHEIDVNFFSDFIWRELLEFTLDLSYRDAVLSKKYYGGRVSQPLLEQRVSNGASTKLDTSDWDIYISQTPFPGEISKNTQLVVRFHDAVPIQYPNTIAKPFRHNLIVSRALRMNSENAFFVCNSETTRKQLIEIDPSLETKSNVSYCCVPDTFQPSAKRSVLDVIMNRMNLRMIDGPDFKGTQKHKAFVKKKFNDEYFLAVSTIEPRKNYNSIIDAWNAYRKESGKDVKLVVVGSWGWKFSDLVPKFNSHILDGNLFLLNRVPLNELIDLYSNAKATITASYFEGFSYSGVESMRCKTPVIASDIETHREVYGDNAFFFNPYSIEEFTSTMREVMNTSKSEIERMVNASSTFSQRYNEAASLSSWEEALTEAQR